MPAPPARIRICHAVAWSAAWLTAALLVYCLGFLLTATGYYARPWPTIDFIEDHPEDRFVRFHRFPLIPLIDDGALPEAHLTRRQLPVLEVLYGPLTWLDRRWWHCGFPLDGRNRRRVVIEDGDVQRVR
ncbi:hypothetical protein LBMAG53_32860 [Planctomycetota bacterium]|nr:hypothetical protein LBMAG53_32860 [Planctomycetota bacterium]